MTTDTDIIALRQPETVYDRLTEIAHVGGVTDAGGRA